jgi:hypothetical protein
MAANTQELKRFVGTWDILTLWHGQTLRGAWASIDWIEDGAFLRIRSDADADSELAQAWGEHTPFPATAIVGSDDLTGTYSYAYADGRDVHRVYQMTLDDREWRTWGVAGPEFHQRSFGVFSEDGERIDLRYEHSKDGESWDLDFEVVYSRR